MIALPHLDPVEAVLLGIFLTKSFDAAVEAMPKPAKSSGVYSFLFAFLGNEKPVIDDLLERRFHTYTLPGPAGPIGPAGSPAAIEQPKDKGK